MKLQRRDSELFPSTSLHFSALLNSNHKSKWTQHLSKRSKLLSFWKSSTLRGILNLKLILIFPNQHQILIVFIKVIIISITDLKLLPIFKKMQWINQNLKIFKIHLVQMNPANIQQSLLFLYTVKTHVTIAEKIYL